MERACGVPQKYLFEKRAVLPAGPDDYRRNNPTYLGQIPEGTSVVGTIDLWNPDTKDVRRFNVGGLVKLARPKF